VICWDPQQATQLVAQGYSAICNLFIHQNIYDELDKPEGVREYGGEFVHAVDSHDDVVGMHLVASAADVILMVGFDFTKPNADQFYFTTNYSAYFPPHVKTFISPPTVQLGLEPVYTTKWFNNSVEANTIRKSIDFYCAQTTYDYMILQNKHIEITKWKFKDKSNHNLSNNTIHTNTMHSHKDNKHYKMVIYQRNGDRKLLELKSAIAKIKAGLAKHGMYLL
jgi:hypothetical protein